MGEPFRQKRCHDACTAELRSGISLVPVLWPRSGCVGLVAVDLTAGGAWHGGHQVLSIPPRRRERAVVSYLTPEETDALLAVPDRASWHGRRDHALLLLAIQTGLRVSELTGLACQDVQLGAGPHVRCHGKGRKDRATPLTSQTARVLKTWLAERANISVQPDAADLRDQAIRSRKVLGGAGDDKSTARSSPRHDSASNKVHLGLGPTDSSSRRDSPR